MKIKFTYKNDISFLECPTNTYFVGFSFPNGENINHGLQYLFKDTTLTKERISLPNGKKVKIIYYISKELHEVMTKYKNMHCMHMMWESTEIDVFL